MGRVKEVMPTSGRIGRFARCLAEIGGEKAAREIACGIGDYEKLSRREKAAWWNETMVRLDKSLGSEKAVKVMALCGSKCCGVQTREKARAIYEKSSSLSDFLEMMNKTGMGGGRLIQESDTVIAGGYDRCYCGQVSAAAKPFTNDLYCECSKAWLEKYFGAIFERPIEVEMLQTIIQGATTCEYRVRIY